METEVKAVFDLSKSFTDIVTLSFYVILATFGVKSVIKNITNKDKVNKYISMSIVLILSMIGTWFLPIPIWWVKLIMGIFITSIAIGLYEPIIKHFLEAIPIVVQAFAQRVADNKIVKAVTKKKTKKGKK